MKLNYLLLGLLICNVARAANPVAPTVLPAPTVNPMANPTTNPIAVTSSVTPPPITTPNRVTPTQVTPTQVTPTTVTPTQAIPVLTMTTLVPSAVVKKPEGHLWNLQGANIKSVIAEISRETGKNFILDPQVDGKITIISSHPMGTKESYEVFLATLRVLGYAVVPDGRNLKIVPSRDAANQSILASNHNPGVGDEAVVRVIPVRYVSAIQLVPALRPLLPTWGNLSAYYPSNSMIISGSADNVQRIADIVAQVDTVSTNGIDVVVLQHAIADDIVKEVNQLLLAARANGASTNATLSADSQSNSVLIGGDEISRLHLKVLIAKLDNQDTDAAHNTQVINLKYIQVKDILPVLKAMIHQSVTYTIGGGGGGAAYSSDGGSSSGGGVNLGQASPQFTAAANNQINNASLNSGSAGGTDDKNRTTIVGDVTNNALIITANSSAMIQLRSVITKLDIPPQQVLVQGIIAEVDAQTMQQMGIQWGTGGTNQTNAGAAASAYAYSAPGMGVGFLQAQDMRALITMLETNANSNIIATPSVAVLNNVSADIEVGQEVFDTSGQYQPSQQGGTAQQPYVTYTSKQIGLTLKVIPQITGDGQVRLIIYQENSAQVEDAQTSSSNPNVPTNEEKISTQVIVDNGQILVLGGLINAQDRKVVTRVPILGYIPIIGLLFQSHKTEKIKKDLMIFLRPVIITDSKMAHKVTQDRYDFMHDAAILNTQGNGDMIASTILAKPKIDLPQPFDEKK